MGTGRDGSPARAMAPQSAAWSGVPMGDGINVTSLDSCPQCGERQTYALRAKGGRLVLRITTDAGQHVDMVYGGGGELVDTGYICPGCLEPLEVEYCTISLYVEVSRRRKYCEGEEQG